jgi:xanthine dehydrogenase YagS FAD-binding subunit
LEVENGAVKNVRLALGGVAHKPWRAFATERILAGAAVTDEVFGRAAEAELALARGYAHNSFKIELAKRAIVGVLRELAGEEGRP